MIKPIVNDKNMEILENFIIFSNRLAENCFFQTREEKFAQYNEVIYIYKKFRYYESDLGKSILYNVMVAINGICEIVSNFNLNSPELQRYILDKKLNLSDIQKQNLKDKKELLDALIKVYEICIEKNKIECDMLFQLAISAANDLKDAELVLKIYNEAEGKVTDGEIKRSLFEYLCKSTMYSNYDKTSIKIYDKVISTRNQPTSLFFTGVIKKFNSSELRLEAYNILKERNELNRDSLLATIARVGRQNIRKEAYETLKQLKIEDNDVFCYSTICIYDKDIVMECYKKLNFEAITDDRLKNEVCRKVICFIEDQEVKKDAFEKALKIKSDNLSALSSAIEYIEDQEIKVRAYSALKPMFSRKFFNARDKGVFIGLKINSFFIALININDEAIKKEAREGIEGTILSIEKAIISDRILPNNAINEIKDEKLKKVVYRAILQAILKKQQEISEYEQKVLEFKSNEGMPTPDDYSRWSDKIDEFKYSLKGHYVSFFENLALSTEDKQFKEEIIRGAEIFAAREDEATKEKMAALREKCGLKKPENCRFM